jgi:deoxycytidylate deaminase
MLKDSTHPSIHAEHNAMYRFLRHNQDRRILRNRNKIDIMVIRLSKTSTIGYSRPCKNCIVRLTNCRYLNINNIYYTDHDGSMKVESFSSMFNSPLTKLSSGDAKKINKKHINRSCC